MTDKDAVASIINYDYTCTNWTDGGNAFSLFKSLYSLSKDFSLRAYFCTIRYRQFDLKPGVYSVTLFFNATTNNTDLSQQSKKLQTPVEGLDFDITDYVQKNGINVGVLPVVGLNFRQLLLSHTSIRSKCYPNSIPHWCTSVFDDRLGVRSVDHCNGYLLFLTYINSSSTYCCELVCFFLLISHSLSDFTVILKHSLRSSFFHFKFSFHSYSLFHPLPFIH